MSEARRLLHDTVTRLFAATVDKEQIARTERGEWPASLWNQVEAAGLTQPHQLGDELEDGWLDAFVILRASGRYCVPLPLAETILATWLLARAGMPVPSGPLTVCATPLDAGQVHDGKVTTTLARLPWGRHCSSAVAVVARQGLAEVILIDLADATVLEGHNLALEPRDDLSAIRSDVEAARPTTLPANIVELYGALVRSAQMAGALDALLEMSVQYAGERLQFGRPIGQFQAIQQELARLAGAAAEAGMAAEVACRAAAEARQDFHATIGASGDPSFEIACAKVIAGDAAELAPRIAHQVHGAIGFTYEHALHFATRRLWAWRADYGTASQWAERLGAHTFAIGPDALWPAVTGRISGRMH
ncbi:MAG TPA: acyl-CoA dehydrogenase family protein [Terriglobales bacterium]|nr:acyl-CoA dehydrogenase family protein [Terriglobales bacterium]